MFGFAVAKDTLMKMIIAGFILSQFLLASPLSAQVFVDVNATGAGNGNSWANAYTSLQPAIADADAANEQVWVADGSYVLAAPLAMADGVAVYAGFQGGGAGETLLSQRDPAAHVATLDLASNFSVTFSGIANAEISGFTLAQLPNAAVAIIVQNSSNIIVSQINAPDLGSSHGVLSLGGSTAIARRLFVRDDGGAGGAASGVAVSSTSTLTLESSAFSGLAGISVLVQNGANAANVFNCTFHNVAWGLRVSAAIPSSATNCIFSGPASGYPIHETTLDGDVVIKNCLFFDTGGVDLREEGSINISGAANINAIPGNANNLDGDPVYANAPAGDFTLGDYSAAVDQGDDSAAPTLDLLGISDLGAQEAPPSVVPVEASAFTVE